MRIPMLAWALAAALLSGTFAASADDENIKVYGTYLTDSDGYDYGVNWYIDSTVNAQTCVYPTVTEQTNVNGSITAGPVMLQANETGFSIGQFIVADQSQAWASNVGAKWQKC